MQQIIPGLSALLIVLVICMDVYRSGYKVTLNPIFWMLFLSFFYLVLPSFFVREIDFYYSWGIDNDSILFSHILVFVFVSTFSILYSVNHSKNLANGFFKYNYNISPLLKVLWWAISFYLLYVFFVNVKGLNASSAFMYDHSQSDPYKIKNVSYLLIALSVLYFFSEKRYWVFLPNVLIIIIDVLGGSRTAAMVALVPMVVCICCYRKTLFIIPGSLVILGFLLIGIIRSDNIVSGVPWYINAIGEFRETYITLPLMISDDRYVGHGGIVDVSAALSLGLLQPVRAQLLEHFEFAGVYIADLVDRGYGLGSNIITESIFYGYFGLVVILALMCFFLMALRFFVLKSRPEIAVVTASFSIVFIRLIVREGFPIYLGLIVFVVIFYCFPIFILDKIKLSRNKSCKT